VAKSVTRPTASVLRVLGGALVGALVFAAGMLVVAASSPACCINPRSLEGVEFIVETVVAGLLAGFAAAKAAGPHARVAVVLALGVLAFGLLAGPGNWQVERFTLVFVAPFAVALGGAMRSPHASAAAGRPSSDHGGGDGSA